MRTRSEIGCDPLAGRQEHTISNCVRIESISQKVDDRVVSEMLKQDVMILKHATATFWRTPASELLVIAAGGSGLKCLMDGRQQGGLFTCAGYPCGRRTRYRRLGHDLECRRL
jgi:hypothetical protein